MTLHQLRAFAAVARLGSVRAAANELYVAQPAISGALRALERSVGVPLVERAGRGIVLTAAGRAFAAEVRAVLDRLDHGLLLARSADSPEQAGVRIAAIATAGERVVLPLLAAFRTTHPDVDVAIRVGNRDTVWGALRHGEADLVVAGRPPPGLPARTLGTAANTLVVVGAAGAQPGGAELSTDLARSTWLLREEGSGTRDAAEELLSVLGLETRRMVLGSNGAVVEGILAGFGIALLPRRAIEERLAQGTLRLLDAPGTPIERPWHLVSRSDLPLTPTAGLVVDALVDDHDGFSPLVELDGRPDP